LISKPGLLGELLSKGQGRSAMTFMAACVVTAQLTTLRSAPIVRDAGYLSRLDECAFDASQKPPSTPG